MESREILGGTKQNKLQTDKESSQICEDIYFAWKWASISSSYNILLLIQTESNAWWQKSATVHNS